MADSEAIKKAKEIMASLVRQPPKPHDEMKLGKPRGTAAKKAAQKKKRT